MVLWVVLAGVGGALAGAGVAAVVVTSRSASRRASAELSTAHALADVRSDLARCQATLDLERAGAAERESALEQTRRQLAGEFAELSAKALAQNNTQFLELADARLKAAQQTANGDLDQRRQAIEQLLDPLREQLGRYEQGLRTLELERQKAYTGLTEQVRYLSESQDRLQAETRNLVTALRAPATRGRWGEMQLRRVVEMAGMVEHCDFEEQVTAVTEEGRLRPDVVVRLPAGRCVVVDAKVPFQAFVDAVESPDEDGRQLHLVAHARQLRAHVDALSKKEYWRQFDRSPEFVVAFIPGDPLLAAALEHDPSLLEHAMASHVVLATPTNLIALLRTVAASWQQEAVAENAQRVQQIGRELYKRLSTFADHLAKAGRGLAGAVDAYNKAVGSLERSVLPQARRFQELGLVGVSERELAEVQQVDASPREPIGSDRPGSVPSLELVVEPRQPPVLPGVADG